MATDYIIPRLLGWLCFVANAIVCVAAVHFYRQRPWRSVLLIIVSAGLGASISAISWMANTDSPFFWMLIDLGNGLDFVLWAIGSCLLFRDFIRYEKRNG